MKIIGVAVLACAVTSSSAWGQTRLRVEFGMHTDVLASLPSDDTLLDGFRLRAAIAGPSAGAVRVEPTLSWQYQRHLDTSWSPFSPGVHNPADWLRSGSVNSQGAHFWEFTLLARTREDGPGFLPFAELESGLAFNTLPDTGPDFLVSFMAGGAWSFVDDLTVALGVGYRLYVPSDRVTIPLALDVGVLF